jgi:hypothetical protein
MSVLLYLLLPYFSRPPYCIDFITCFQSKIADISTLKILFSKQYLRVTNRMQSYLDQKPNADNNFYCLLQGLPDDEKKQAALHNHVQTKVKEELGHRMPTFILMFDFYMIVAVITCFGVAVTRYNQWLFSSGESPLNINGFLWFVISGGIYFLVREVMQAYSF